MIAKRLAQGPREVKNTLLRLEISLTFRVNFWSLQAYCKVNVRFSMIILNVHLLSTLNVLSPYVVIFLNV